MTEWLSKRSVVLAKSVRNNRRRKTSFFDSDRSQESIRAPSGYETTLNYFPIGIEHTRPGAHHDKAEPLLSLLTSSHPWLGGTINGSLSAYSSTKSYSPRFIQNGAEFVEKNIGSPMASTVGAVGRRTGVEGSLRRYLRSQRPSRSQRIDPEILNDTMNKKRKVSVDDDIGDAMDLEHSVHETPQYICDLKMTARNNSVDTLPIYDENKSPAYEEDTDSAVCESRKSRDGPHSNRSWSTQLMISTSGLGAALSEGSLRSLKYCLAILRNANGHVRHLMQALKQLVRDYNKSPERSLEEGEMSSVSDKTRDAMQIDTNLPSEATLIAERIRKLNDEIWQTFKNVVNIVSRYTGGALPENASAVVRWQLMSVPRRWQRAVTRSAHASSDDAVSSANRMLAFAVEGLDMMEQVGGVVDSTIVSAEKWLDSLGRKRQEGADGALDQTKVKD